MPIIGLTDRRASFPQLGILRKGAPKPQNGNKPGADLKYFRFDCEDAATAKAFHDIYGAEPRAIRVFVPFATTNENFEAWREEYVASGLKHRCDGATCVRWLDSKTGTYSDQPKPCPGGCKQVGRLQVIIPELKRMAFVTVLTTSIHDILQIHANLMALEAARGSLQGIPLILKRAPRKISTPSDDGKRARREKWLITIEAQQQWVELQLSAQEQAALPSTRPLALPEWDGEEDEEEEAAELEPIIEQPKPANGNGKKHAADLPTEFWTRGHTAGIKDADLQETVSQVMAGNITWAEAIESLPPVSDGTLHIKKPFATEKA